MNFKPTLLYTLFITLLFSCTDEPNDTTDDGLTQTNGEPNILLIIADDMGLDASPGYSIGSVKPNMPNLQSMINSGITFNNLWSNPTCTPTRSSIITGKYGFRTEMTQVGDVLSTSEVTLQRYLDNQNSGYSSAVIGKWHIGGNNANHPTNMGLSYFAGLLSGGVQSYTNWSFVENGTTITSTEYTTTKFTDLAIDWIDNQTEPWFLWLAYNAPHTPIHLPPNNLHSQGNLPTDNASIAANPTPYYMAMLEAMDTEMGRLIASMSQEEKDNTVIIFIGDNGTPNQVVQEYASARAKGTVYQGGINVPMIISGKNVNRVNTTENALINTTDLFTTIANIAGVGPTELNDSKSFETLLTTSNVTVRDYVYAEAGNNSGNSDKTIRNTTHKYILFDDGSEALYNLSSNSMESPNLLNANQLPLNAENTAAKDELVAKLIEIQQ